MINCTPPRGGFITTEIPHPNPDPPSLEILFNDSYNRVIFCGSCSRAINVFLFAFTCFVRAP